MSDGLNERSDVCQTVVVKIVGGREEKDISNLTGRTLVTLLI